MGARGPRPEPSKLKLVKGNPGHRPINDREPKPAVAMPRYPSFLGKEERKIWQKISKILFEMGVLTEIDGLALGVFCQYFLEFWKLSDQVKKTGVFVKMKNGKETKTFVDPETGAKVEKEIDRFVLVRSPVAGARDLAWDKAAKIMACFGLTPSDRMKLKVELTQSKPGDSYEAFRGHKKA